MLTLALLLIAQFADDALPTGTYSGVCLYPEAVQARAAPGELVLCSEATIAGDHISFGQRGWRTRTRFNGIFEGSRMTVDSVTLPNGRTVAVRGVCEVYFADDALSTVACTATSTRGSMAANFVVSRI
ncbi:hypothetical protein [Aurantiacibacter poecillastricola]|uniref:hypothetical protein n=1 Tax=Aurantiacibacter poecillastricola TaxID=3064385 RepID=UPI00273F54E7|nr:hypothetical protein [Aurantiacibacter sp. 219JJ12-13]MDP5260656.1 hypothetical protein [Aurantiacibacter sp. 219JJ12-13]